MSLWFRTKIQALLQPREYQTCARPCERAVTDTLSRTGLTIESKIVSCAQSIWTLEVGLEPAIEILFRRKRAVTNI
jgi:hypothetical protein